MAMFNSFWYLYQSIPSAKILESAMAIFIHSKPPMWLTLRSAVGNFLTPHFKREKARPFPKVRGYPLEFIKFIHFSFAFPLQTNPCSMVLEYESQHLLLSKITQ